MAQVLSLFTNHPWSYSWRISFDLTLFLFSVLFSHLELFSELVNPIVMASLRYSAAVESEDTLNAFTSPTRLGEATEDRKVRRMKEHASLGARWERDVTEPSHSFQ